MNHETTPPYLRDQFTTCDHIQKKSLCNISATEGESQGHKNATNWRPVQLEPGVSIVQENLNYSPALCVVCKMLPQILPQLQKLRVHFNQGRRSVFDMGYDFVSCTGGVWGGCAPCKKLDFFLKLESCNLVNTFRHKFTAGDDKWGKNKQTNKQTVHGPD